MSQPASPTRVNRNAVVLRAVPSRRSEASAIMRTGADAHPVDRGETGCGPLRIALTRSPVIRVKANNPGMSSFVSGPMISWTSPPDEKLPPARSPQSP